MREFAVVKVGGVIQAPVWPDFPNVMPDTVVALRCDGTSWTAYDKADALPASFSTAEAAQTKP